MRGSKSEILNPMPLKIDPENLTLNSTHFTLHPTPYTRKQEWDDERRQKMYGGAEAAMR
jgi:hypothetical protein